MSWKTPLRVLGYGYLAYLALSLVVILPALNFLAPWAVEKYTGRKLTTDIILFNPFTLAVEVRNAALPEKNGEPFTAFDKARVDLSVASLWQPGIVLDEASLDGLYLHVQRLDSGDFNFSDMLPPEPAGDPPEETPAAETAESGIMALTIDTLRLGAHRLEFTDRQRQTPFNTHWDELGLNANGLTTVAEAGKPYRLQLEDESGGSLVWEGEVSIPAASSQGSLELNGLDLVPLWRFAEPWLKFELGSGQFNAGGAYRVNWGGELDYAITGGEAGITGLTIAAREGVDIPETGVELAELQLSGIEVDGAAQQVGVDKLALDGIQLAGFSEGEQVSLADLFAVDLPASDEDPVDEETKPWTLHLDEVELSGSTVRWRSEYTDPPLLTIAPLDLRLENLQWPLAGDTGLDIDLAINDEARLTIAGSLGLATGDGAIDVELSELPMAWFSPNIPEAFNAELNAGWISTTGTVALKGFAPAQVQLDGSSRDVEGVIRGEENSFQGWDRVDWRRLVVDLENRRLNLQKLAVNGWSGRVHIYEDGTINTQRVMQAEVEQAAEEGTLDEEAMDAWRYAVDMITLDNSRVDFMDESMPLVFRTQIGDVRGYVADLSTDDTAEVELRGSVDGYAPVRLDGTANVLGESTEVDLSLSFEGLDLVRLTPYSGTYAGYAIDRGTLNVDVQYSLQGSRLQGDNALLIDQLKLGNKIDSDRAMDIPLKLGLALLTDINGVIDLEVPVSGDVDNPEFSIAGIVFKAIGNLITKAATAPFKLLASLVSAEEDLQRINFPLGSAEPDDIARGKLADLAKAMAQRPALKLVIFGRLNLASDRERLQRDALRAELLDAGISRQAIDEGDETWAAAVSARYAALSGTESVADVPITSQYDALVANVPVADDALLKLAADRAVAVKQVLVNEGGLAADRAVIEQANISPGENNFSGAELDVDA